MLRHQPFYHKAIKSSIVAFGSIFKDMKILRETPEGDQKEIEIPIRYISQEKGYARTRDEFGSLPDFWQITPRMSFWIPSAPEYVPERNPNQLTKIKVPSNDSSERSFFYRPAPFRITFEMNILTKYEEDMFQIMEQLLPFFRPDYTVSVYTPDGQSIEIPFTLESSTWEMDPEGGMEEERRRIEATLNFNAIIYLYGPEATQSIITQVDIDLEYQTLEGDYELVETFSASAEDYPNG